MANYHHRNLCVRSLKREMTTGSRPGSGPKAGEEKSGRDCGFVAPIGKTPILRIRLLIGGKSRKVYLKLEGENPGGSIKDRTALSLLHNLEKTGQLRQGVRLIESSSGNLAIGLAMLAPLDLSPLRGQTAR